jgi:hypothetical protein
MDLATVVDELYGLDPPAFVSTRDARAAEARRAGDRQLAGNIKALKRPSAPAWAVNLLARNHQGPLRELLSLGAALRHAQETLSADEMRLLARQRHAVVAGLAGEARHLATGRDQPLSEAAVRQVEATLMAALADPDAADAVSGGCLVRSLEHAGLGTVDLDGAVAGGAPARPKRARLSVVRPAAERTASDEPPPSEEPAAADPELDAARAEVEAAAAEVEQADAEVEQAAASQADAAQALASRQDQVTALEAQLAALETQVAEARAEAGSAGADAQAASEAHESARTRAATARQHQAVAEKRLRALE